MKVLLMPPAYVTREAEFCDLGLGYLASGLLLAGHSVKLCLAPPGEAHLAELLSSEAPDLIGMKVLTTNAAAAARTVRAIRERSGAVIVIGGPHVTGDPSGALDCIPADYAISSEADISFTKLAELLSAGTLESGKSSLPGLIYRDNGAVRVNPPELITSLDSLPFPAWELMPPGSHPSLVFKRFPVAGIIATRGCSNLCSFCSESHKKLRFRSVENVLAEIRYLVGAFGVKEIQFLDSNFTASRAYIKALCGAILESGLSLSFCAPNGGRLEHIDEEICSLLARIGFYRMNIGVESGSPEILESVQKGCGLSGLSGKIDLLRAHGIQTIGNFMLGFPGETRRQMQRTLDLALSLDLSAVNVSIYTPMPGTKLYQRLAEEGRLPRDHAFADYNFVAYENTLSELSPKELRRFRTKFMLAFVLRWRTLRTLYELLKSGIAWNSLVKRIYWMYISKMGK